MSLITACFLKIFCARGAVVKVKKSHGMQHVEKQFKTKFYSKTTEREEEILWLDLWLYIRAREIMRKRKDRDIY